MQVKISKQLAAIIARTTFTTARQQRHTALDDHLAEALIGDESSLAYQLLSHRLQGWELYQIRLRLQQALRKAEATQTLPIDPEDHFRALGEQLCAKYATAGSITTAHALRELLTREESLLAPILARYRFTINDLEQLMKESSEPSSSLAHHRPKSDADHREELSALFRSLNEPAIRMLDNNPTINPQKLIDRLGTDLTARARQGLIDPVVGREEEIERLMQVLARRRKNNPILVGEAGVGKSALVEGLALRLAAGEVTHTLRNKRLVSLDVAALVAGTKFRGEFEERLRQLIDELTESSDVILFIDEIHTIVGSGTTQGSLDTANILKPALARGELQLIGATTYDEYRTHIERDGALARRFQRITLEPPTAEATRQILHKLAPHYARHHRVRYTDEALEAAVELTERYLNDRQQPDKAIDLIDEAGARAAGGEVDRTTIERLIASVTGIAIERLGEGEQRRLQGLERHLSERIIGQREAIGRLTEAILRARSGLRDGRRPIGVFLFVGPTGVGKTLLAKELSQQLFEQRQGLIRLDMSEYGERHQIARLIGSPPGYVGYGEGGELTEAVRRQPYAVVLLDEIEKAHPDLCHLLLQLFDEGRLTDSAGRRVDFRNTIIIMTSNLGSREALDEGRRVGFSARRQTTPPSDRRSLYRKALERHFSPELLNRIDEVICFESLGEQELIEIMDLEARSLIARASALGYTLRITPRARQRLARSAQQPHAGARALKRTLIEQVEAPLARLIVEGRIAEGDKVVVEGDRREGVRLRVA